MKKIFLLLFLPWFVFALTPSQNLQQKLFSLKSITADFHQTINGEEGSILQESSGKMSILRPGQFRWETINPTQQLIITNGKKLWLYEADLKQVTIKTLNQNLSETPILLLTKTNLDLDRQFNIKQLNKNQFELSPKNKDKLFNTITIMFKGEKIIQLLLKNSLGQITKIQFSNIKLNQPLSLKQFSFKPPKGVDIVSE